MAASPIASSARYLKQRRVVVAAFLASWLLGAAAMAAAAMAAAAAAVPAVYVFGDSLADVGNNNYLDFSLLKADFPHNGIDYPGQQATGRFSNGKNFPDFLAASLGLATSPPYLSLSSSGNRNYQNGVNFASGGAGVSNSTNKGQCISLDKQIEYYGRAYAEVVQQLGQAEAAGLMARSMFAVVIGSNDIINYVKSGADDKAKNPSQHFVDSLIQSLTGQLQRLYNLGARKFMFLGTGPIGCCPSLRELSASKDCSQEANDLSAQYNTAVASLLRQMSAQRADMSYSMFDAFTALLHYIQHPASYGFTEVKAACCGIGDLKAKIGCTPVSSYCSNRTAHIFWDFYHPTEITVQKLAAAAFDGSAPFVYPMNIRQLGAV